MDTIRNPIEWGVDQFKQSALAMKLTGRSVSGADAGAEASHPKIRQISTAEIRDAMTRGMADFGAYRTDVIFLCIIYPVIGLVLARFAFQEATLPLLFPLAIGFAFVGPVAAVGLYEMSRLSELGQDASWGDAFNIVRSPSFGAIMVLGLMLLLVFLLWMIAAQAIYMVTLGPAPPASPGAFLRDVFTTGEGWAMIALGAGVGFLFAVVVLAISVVSFPMLVDRDVGLRAAVWTSLRAVAANPVPMAAWGVVVAGALVIGSIPLFLGLIIILPLLGHATWHLYRKVVEQ